MEVGPLDRPYRDEGDLSEPSMINEAALDEPPGERATGVSGLVYDDLALDGVAVGAVGLPDGELTDPHHGQADPDGPDLDQHTPDEHELRPARRLRIWHTAPIVALAVLGSLMFAFPLAFEFGDGGPAVAMLGLLLSASSAGSGIMIARRVGYTWPGMPQRGSGERPDWRYVACYAVLSVVIGVLAVWRVARLH